MEFFAFDLMAWPDLPADYDGPAWVTCPNAFFDPERGTELYNSSLDTLEYAERIGFDGICVNEHHQSPYGLMPSPNLFAAMLIRRTTTARISVLGNALPLYNPPLRLAEELAVLDVISGGRLDCGFVVGGAPEYFSYGINPAEARARYAEAVDLILQAWTQPGPTEFHGRYYQLAYVNPWPRPVQQPHPPVWVPGIGSVETMEMCARRGFAYVGLPFFSRTLAEKNYQLFRTTWLAEGNPVAPGKLGGIFPVYVADSDAAARRDFEQHWWYFAKRLLQGGMPAAPGYMSAKSALRAMELMGTNHAGTATTWEQLEEMGALFVGSPDTVTDRLAERIAALGCGRVYVQFRIGGMADELVRNSLDLLAGAVMPALRKEFPKGPDWAEG